jgi:hypothetical protein
MKSTNNYENKKVKTNEKEKRSIMYSQIFNYNLMSRDPMMRSVEVTAAVEAGGKDISNKKAVLYTLLVIAIVFVLCYLRHPAAQALNQFILEKSEVKMNLEEPESVVLDMETIAARSVGHSIRNGYSYEETYDCWAEIPFENISKDLAKENDDIKFYRFDIGTDENRLGVVRVDVVNNDTNKYYTLKGSFKIAGYTGKQTELINVGNKATFSYQSENGITAYFIRNWSYGDYTVYFMLDKILFEMEASASKESVEDVKEIIDAMMG